MNPLLLIAIGGLVLFVVSKARTGAAIASLEYTIQSIDTSCEGFLCLNPVIQITIKVFNPTDQAIEIKSFTGHVYLNGDDIGTVYAFNLPKINANNVTAISINVTGNSLDLLSQAVKIIKGQIGPNVTIRIKGTVNGENVLVPLDIQKRLL